MLKKNRFTPMISNVDVIVGFTRNLHNRKSSNKKKILISHREIPK